MTAAKRRTVEPKPDAAAELRYVDPPATKPSPARAPLDESTPSTESPVTPPAATMPAPESVPSEMEPASPGP